MTPLERTDLVGWHLEGGADPTDRLERAVAAARAGRPVVHPTETVYGVGSGLGEAGVRAVCAAKRRSDQKPILALVEGVDAVPELEWTDEARELARLFWPGAVTLVLGDPRATFPAGVRSAGGTVAIRHSPHPIASALVRALGGPLTSSSANRPGEPPATDSEAAARFARDLLDDGIGAPHLIDAGALPPAPPSTLVDCTTPEPRVLREGAVPVTRLRCVLPRIS
ncbi:MAG: L-threonylcarbamoyladenylate synthase [Longimicrobiales bacterium]|nr:L-threonylcarbamoyladenylate synthase [Longimicrobiales bacterium]